MFNYISRPKNSFWILPRPPNCPLGPQKVKNDPQNKSKSKVRIEVTIEKKLLNYISRPQNNFLTLTRPQKWPIRAQKNQKWPKTKSKSKVRIEGTIENKSCSTTGVDPKRVFGPYPDPKNSPLWPNKLKMAQKLLEIKSQNWRNFRK